MSDFSDGVTTFFNWSLTFFNSLRDMFPLNLFLATCILSIPLLLILRARDGR